MDKYRIRSLETVIRELAPVFEQRVFWLTGIVIFLILLTTAAIVLHVKSNKKFLTVDKTDFSAWKKFLFALNRYKYLLTWIIIVVPIFIIGWQFTFLTFYIRPNVILSTPAHGSVMSNAEPRFEIEFDLPIDQETLDFNVSPEIKGEWKLETVWNSESLARKAIFTPEESIAPGQPVVIYITGMRSWNSDGKLHEQPIEFTSPSVPDVKSTIPEDKKLDFVPSDDVIVEYDANLGDFVDITYEITPSVPFQVEKVGPATERINFSEDLAQDTEYQLKAYRETRTYNLETKEDVSRDETEEILSISFTTVSTPLLESYSPKGEGANPESSIEATFDQKMNMEDVESNFTISPEIDGEISWKDEKTFQFDPTENLERGTKYTVTFKKGIRSDVYGITEEDIIFSFETAGKVVVNSFSPIDGSTGHDTALTISVTFNQEVDKESAQSKFSLSPSRSGTFSWDGNIMKYTVSGLEYYTDYTATVSPGVKSLYGIDSDQSFTSVFGTRSNLFTLTMPWYQQQENFTCNIAATRMVLAYYGIYLTEQQIKDGVGYSNDPNVGWVSGYGVHIGPVANFVSQYREVEIKTGWNVVDLAHEIEAGHPVILWWYNRYSQPAGPFTLPSGATGYVGMHSEIARGFIGSADNPTAIMVHDPWRQYLTYDTAQFVSNWGYLNHTALVVK